MQPYEKDRTWPQRPSDMEQLSLLFSAQQMTTAAADKLVLQESQKTLGIYQEVITTSKAENQALQLEVAALRERLTTKESQVKELKALHAAEKKAIQERSAEEIAALSKSLKKSKKRTKALNKISTIQVNDWKQSLESGELLPEESREVTKIYTTLDEKRKVAGGKK